MGQEMSRRAFLDKGATGVCACALAAGVAGAGEAAPGEKPALDGYCGIYCGSCPLYLKSKAAKDPAKVVCLGCKSDKTAPHCTTCAIKTCAQGKKLSSCGQCKGFPCAKTKPFHGNGEDYRLLAEKSCYAIRDGGCGAWLKAQPKRWTCPKCGTRFSFKDEACPKCGADVYSCKEEAADYRKTRKP